MADNGTNRPASVEATVQHALALDEAATDLVEVEAAYQHALAVAPRSARLRGAYLNFLVTVARVGDCQEEWERVLRMDLDDDVHELVHLPLAVMLVHRGELDFATEVLGALPARYNEDKRAIALRRRVQALLEARDGRGYVPGPLLEPEWWRHGPFLVPAELDGVSLDSWLACYVEDVEDSVLHCSCGEVSAGELVSGLLATIERDQLELWCGPVPEGFGAHHFFELGRYGSRVLGAYHAKGLWVDPNLPAPLFEPERYLRQRWPW